MNRRTALQSLLKLLVLHLIVLAAFVLPAYLGRFLIPAMSPHISIVGAIASRIVGLSAVVCLPMLVIVTLRRRWFCRYLCPVGLIVDSCARVRRMPKHGYRKVPPMGQWLMLATLGGAFVGWPLFIWLDPLSIFTASLNASRWPLDAVAISSLGVMVGLVLVSVIFPKLWCPKLCPLGGMQEFLFGVKLLATKKRNEAPSSLSALALARRSAIFAGLGVAGGIAVARYDRRDKPPKLRPPGAVDNTKFKSLCARCGNCVKACPSGIIRQDTDLADPAGLLTPFVYFHKSGQTIEDYAKYCLSDCNACTQACPTGAIEPLLLEEKLLRPMGKAHVDMSGCLLRGEQGGDMLLGPSDAGVPDGVLSGGHCGNCVSINKCPTEAISLVNLDEFGTEQEVVIIQSKCIGCGACLVACPVKVIDIRPPVQLE